MDNLALAVDVVLNGKELAARLDPTGKHVTEWTIRRWRLKDDLPCISAGGRFLFRLSSVLRWMDEQERGGTANKEEIKMGVRRID